LDSDLSKITPLNAWVYWMLAAGIIYFLIVGFYQLEEGHKRHVIVKQVQSEKSPDKNGYVNYPRLKIEVKEEIFDPLIVKACDKHNIDPALVKAIIMAESSYNPMAVSRKGARGLMQLMPATISDLGVADPFDPELNINGGIVHLKKLLRQFKGDIRLSLAAYHAGSRKVKKYKGIPPYRGTQYYIKNVLKYYQQYRNDSKHDDGNKA
jgi:soluble lytic murein transglycosylase-like protein